MKIKFNWGTGIVITTVIFMTISIGTTLFFMNQKVELVDDNYYEKELAYQQQVSKLQKTIDMGAEVDINYENSSVLLKFPQKHLSGKVSGEIVLYRAASAIKDYKIPVSPDSTGTQQIKTDGMTKGLWKVRVAWASADNEFYTEKKLMVY